MKSPARLLPLALAAATCLLPAGCLLKPTTMATRSFVLAPLPAAERGLAGERPLPVGVATVKMPSYLTRSSLVLRLGTNEIHYLENALWAEPLDQSFQRTLAANLGTLLPTDQVRLSAWQRAEVALAVYVSVEQFDVDAEGRGNLTAWWRITSPDGNKVLRSGQSRLTQSGPARPSPEAIVKTLNELTAELSRTLAQAIRESAAAGR